MSDFLVEVERLKKEQLTRKQRDFLRDEVGTRWECNPPVIADYKSPERYVTDLGLYADRCLATPPLSTVEPVAEADETAISRCLHGSKATATCARECLACGCTCDVHRALIHDGKACGGKNDSCNCPGWVEVDATPAAARTARRQFEKTVALLREVLDGLGLDPAQALLARHAYAAATKAFQSLLDDEAVRAMQIPPGRARPMTELGREYLKAICLAEFKRHGRVTPCRIPSPIARPLQRLGFIVPAVAPPGYSAEGLFVPTPAGRFALRFQTNGPADSSAR